MTPVSVPGVPLLEETFEVLELGIAGLVVYIDAADAPIPISKVVEEVEIVLSINIGTDVGNILNENGARKDILFEVGPVKVVVSSDKAPPNGIGTPAKLKFPLTAKFPVRAKSPIRTLEIYVSPEVRPRVPKTLELPTMFPVKVEYVLEA